MAGADSYARWDLGPTSAAVEQRLHQWESSRFAQRLAEKDPTLWLPNPRPEAEDRLGWLDLPKAMLPRVPELTDFADEVRGSGIRQVILLGMGGSSLAPEVFQQAFGTREGYPDLAVLDSTHPMAVRAVEARIDLRETLFVVSSKSGTTTETRSLFLYFWNLVSSMSPSPGRSFVAITDPGSALEITAKELGFRRVFVAPPDVGGRYSALSVFGLVPAALIGVDIRRLLDLAIAMAHACAPSESGIPNPGLRLGATLGELALGGRDKATFLSTPEISSFLPWVEQLIAESTGKDGVGIVPVTGEDPGSQATYGDDRLFFVLRIADGAESAILRERAEGLVAAGHPIFDIVLSDPYDLGAEFFRWEVAVAAAGSVLAIQPFDQPDVQMAKDLARDAMSADAQPDPDGSMAGHRPPAIVSVHDTGALDSALSTLLTTISPGDYLGIQAYLAPSPEVTEALHRARTLAGDQFGISTTVGYGPRYLHSTGQLHKGGAANGLFLQITDQPDQDVDVPETSYSFRKLIQAQADGDATALANKGRRILRILVGREPLRGVGQLAEAFERIISNASE